MIGDPRDGRWIDGPPGLYRDAPQRFWVPWPWRERLRRRLGALLCRIGLHRWVPRHGVDCCVSEHRHDRCSRAGCVKEHDDLLPDDHDTLPCEVFPLPCRPLPLPGPVPPHRPGSGYHPPRSKVTPVRPEPAPRTCRDVDDRPPPTAAPSRGTPRSD